MTFQKEITLSPYPRGFHLITEMIVNELPQVSGIAHLFIKHTSASLTINENADPNVLKDLKKYMQSIVPYNSYFPLSKNQEEIFYEHFQEGSDDMPAHIKTSLTNTTLSLSFQKGQLVIGTWQAIYLWEHRFEKKERNIVIHIIGEKVT